MENVTVWTYDSPGHDVTGRTGNEGRKKGNDNVEMGAMNVAFICDDTDTDGKLQDRKDSVEGEIIPYLEAIALETFPPGGSHETIQAPTENPSTSTIAAQPDNDIKERDEPVRYDIKPEVHVDNVTAGEDEDVGCGATNKDDLDEDFPEISAPPKIESLTNMRDVNRILNSKLSTCDDSKWRRIMATLLGHVTPTGDSAATN